MLYNWYYSPRGSKKSGTKIRNHPFFIIFCAVVNCFGNPPWQVPSALSFGFVRYVPRRSMFPRFPISIPPFMTLTSPLSLRLIVVSFAFGLPVAVIGSMAIFFWYVPGLHHFLASFSSFLNLKHPLSFVAFSWLSLIVVSVVAVGVSLLAVGIPFHVLVVPLVIIVWLLAG